MRKKTPWIAFWVSAAWLLLSLPLKTGQLEEFGRLPVLQNGRVKPLDTIARTALLILCGKQDVQADGRKLGPEEWLLELSADPKRTDSIPVFTIDDPDVLGLIHLESRKERAYSFKELEPRLADIRAQAAEAEQVDAKLRSRFQAAVFHLDERLLLYQRLKNSLQLAGAGDFSRELDSYEASLPLGLKAVAAHHKGKPFDRKGLATIAAFFQRYRFLAQAAYFRALPPLSGEPPDAWLNMGEGLLKALKSGSLRLGIRDYARILKAWRDSDPESFRQAIRKYRAELQARVPAETSWADYETAFNNFEPFYKGLVLYLIAGLLALFSWLKPQNPSASPLRRAALLQLSLAFGVHTLGLASRMLIQGRPPVTNLYSSAVFVGWAGAGLGIILERIHKNGVGAVAASAIGFATLIIAHHLSLSGDTLEMMQAVLDSNFWLSTHVVAITTGYSSTFLAGALAHVYIFRRLFGTMDKAAAKSLTQMTYGVVCFSLLMSFVGTVLGGIWADQSWGRFWGWDPKENGAFLIVLWNAIILHARWGGFVRERGLMAMAVFGNIVTSLSWFGVNMLGIGLHSYGWTEKAFFWLALFILSQLAVMGLGLLNPKSVYIRHQTA